MAVYICSDLHGMYDLYTKINDFLKPEDTMICLGDCGDRGPKGWKTIKAVYENPQWKYLMGNHEDMLIEAMREYIDKEYHSEMYNGQARQCLFNNGGESTFVAWEKDLDKPFKYWLQALQALPKCYTYMNDHGVRFILTHSGFTPGQHTDYLWDRGHFKDEWPRVDTMMRTVCAHGHTPIPHIDKTFKERKSYWYCNSHKVCIDHGAFHTGYTVILNLDTYEDIMFEI